MPDQQAIATRIIPLSKGMVAIVDSEDYERVAALSWYAYQSPQGIWYARHRKPQVYMHRFILGLDAETPRVDHKDHNGLNNTRSNLRIAPTGQNQWNARRSKRNKTRFKGVRVYTDCKSRPFMAQIKFNGKFQRIGSFATAEEAGRAYDETARELFGEFACLNFPRKGEQQA